MAIDNWKYVMENVWMEHFSSNILGSSAGLLIKLTWDRLISKKKHTYDCMGNPHNMRDSKDE